MLCCVHAIAEHDGPETRGLASEALNGYSCSQELARRWPGSISLTHRYFMTMSIDDKLNELGIKLPPVSSPAAAYVPYVKTGNLVFLSGHIARKDGKPWEGKLGQNMDTTEGQLAARAVAIDLLGTLRAACDGKLDRVRRIVKIMSLVNSTPEFTEQHLVTNGCSELLAELLGDKGTHARSAFGVAQIPMGSCVEIDLIAEID